MSLDMTVMLKPIPHSTLKVLNMGFVGQRKEEGMIGEILVSRMWGHTDT